MFSCAPYTYFGRSVLRGPARYSVKLMKGKIGITCLQPLYKKKKKEKRKPSWFREPGWIFRWLWCFYIWGVCMDLLVWLLYEQVDANFLFNYTYFVWGRMVSRLIYDLIEVSYFLAYCCCWLTFPNYWISDKQRSWLSLNPFQLSAEFPYWYW